MSGRVRGAVALPAAITAVALSAALVGAIAELTRVELEVARHRRATATVLAAADACLARVLAAMPAAWDFAATLAGPDGVAATADDGVVPAPAGCTAIAADAPGAAGRVVLTVDARSVAGHRTVTAIAGHVTLPGAPALVWLPALPPAGAVAGIVSVDGANADDPTVPDLAGIAAPADLDRLDAWNAASVTSSARTTSPRWAPPPPLDALVARVRAAGAGGPVLVAGTPPATLAFAPADLAVTAALQGAGLLVVDGTLDVQGPLRFTGVVAARRVRVAAGASLTVDGALWTGDAADPLRVAGTLGLRQRRSAVMQADALAVLPRLAGLLSLRDVGG